MLKHHRNVLIVALIALVNMLGYGIVIPLLYGYSKRFGLSDFQNGLLFAVYSVCQFLATPIIGRLSDQHGRKPLLLISVSGTALSFILMAIAPNVFFLFLARIVDGITAGNIPVALAVVSDSTSPQDRPRAFGLIGSAFNFGFIFGPAIAAFTVGISPALPFIIAAIITILAIILTWIYLPETNTHRIEVENKKFIDFGHLWRTLFDPNVGITFLITLIYFLAFSCAIIYGFQPFTAHILRLSLSQNAQLFTLFGIVGLVSQNLIVDRTAKLLGNKKAFSLSLLFVAISLFIMFGLPYLIVFILALILLALANSIGQTLITTILSQETDAKSQGSIMGLNASYQSIGMIIGPLLGGVVATISSNFPFLIGSLLIFVCFILSFRVLRPGLHQDTAF